MRTSFHEIVLKYNGKLYFLDRLLNKVIASEVWELSFMSANSQLANKDVKKMVNFILT